jgi:hypothetical protein
VALQNSSRPKPEVVLKVAGVPGELEGIDKSADLHRVTHY